MIVRCWAVQGLVVLGPGSWSWWTWCRVGVGSRGWHLGSWAFIDFGDVGATTAVWMVLDLDVIILIDLGWLMVIVCRVQVRAVATISHCCCEWSIQHPKKWKCEDSTIRSSYV